MGDCIDDSLLPGERWILRCAKEEAIRAETTVLPHVHPYYLNGSLDEMRQGRFFDSLHFIRCLSFGVGQAQDVVYSQPLVLSSHTRR